MENCFLDLEKKIKIPQNSECFFGIEKDTNWKYCIKITFDLSKEIDYLNLYLIIQSYVNSKKYPIFQISTFFYDKNLKIAISRKESINSLKKISFESFMEWINENVLRDELYEKNELKSNLYGFILMFDKKLIYLLEQKIKIDISENLKPNYPWSENWLNFFKNSIEYTNFLEKKILLLDEKIKKLQNPDK